MEADLAHYTPIAEPRPERGRSPARLTRLTRATLLPEPGRASCARRWACSRSATSRPPRATCRDLRGGPWGAGEVRLGDDTAAIPDGEGYLLFAAEGMWPELVASEPRFAGYCAVMVNASDVYAMGGRPLAIVDALFAASAEAAEPIWRGMADAAERFGVPIVGGHTNLHSPYAGLAAAVLGRARRLLTSFDARPGDELVAAVDLRGRMHPRHPFWNASLRRPARAPARRLRAPARAGRGRAWRAAARTSAWAGSPARR